MKKRSKPEGRRRILMKLYLSFVRPAFLHGLAAGQGRRRQAPLCERCGGRIATQVHHMAGRSGDALVDTEWFAGLCQWCHDDIHDNPEQARKAGWMESKYSRSPQAAKLGVEFFEGSEDAVSEKAAAGGEDSQEGEDDVAE